MPSIEEIKTGIEAKRRQRAKGTRKIWIDISKLKEKMSKGVDKLRSGTEELRKGIEEKRKEFSKK